MTDPAHPHPDPRSARRATLSQIVNAVFWGFLGVRRGDAMRRDLVTIRPLQIVIVGIVAAALFVFTLLALVRLITRGLT
jgi:hypothetical protein